MHPPGIHPLTTHLLLDVTPQEQTTAAGIVLPTAVQGASTRMEAVIVGRGPDCTRPQLTCGTQVYVGRYASSELMRGGRSYRLAQEADIIATLDSLSVSLPEARTTPLTTL
jgi:co-chaperonin GroES (HSP10)